MKLPIFLSTALLAVPALAQESATTPAPEPAPIISTDTPTDSAMDDNDEKVMVVTAERNPQPLSETPSTVTVITRTEIEAKKPFDVTDLLRTVPGLSVAQTGTYGKSTSIFMRGTNSNHTLVLVDGVRANSPQDGRFDFGQIPVENIERIEVVRGPGSALYGSDAIGGVINIITRRGSGPFRTGGTLEVGNHGTNRQSIDGGGAFGRNRLSFSAFRRDTNGQFRNDDFRDGGLSLRFDREVAANQNLAFIARTSRSKFGVPGQQDLSYNPLQRDNSRDTTLSLQFTNKAGRRRDQIIVGTYNRDLTDDATRGATPSAPNNSTFSNRVQTIDAQTSYDFGSNLLTAGLEERREKADVFSSSTFGNSAYDKKTTTHAFFVQDEIKTGKFTLVPSARHEHNSQFGGFNSYRLASAFDVAPRTKLKATYGTAFKAPAFDSLYFPNFGNPNLKPERSHGFEVGVLQTLDSNGGSVEATYFNNHISDLIGFDPNTFLPINVNSAKTSGVELALEKPLAKGFKLLANGTYTHVTSSAGKLLRRPKYTASADLLTTRGKWDYDLGFVAQGSRFDNNFVTDLGPRDYSGYTRFDFTLGYHLKSGVQLYTRVGNILNHQYEEAAGYPAPHFNIVFGVKTLSF